jgi:hypothetical protein
MKLFRRKPKTYQPPMHIDKFWPIYKENVFVDDHRRRLPFWLPPLIALLTIVLVVFYLAPTLSQRLTGRDAETGAADGPSINRLYGSDARVVIAPVADVFNQADLKASRLTQVLYNEPVTVLPAETTYGFDLVRLIDGTRGFMLESDLSANCDSIEPSLATHKLVVITGSKRIMSHAKTGTLLTEVMMGTTLYADYRGDGISRVLLPGGQAGWISDDGLVILPPDGQIEPIDSGARYFTSTALTFLNVTLLNQGISIRGASIPGIARISAAVNGISLPRILADQIRSGEAVSLSRDPDTDLVLQSSLQPGDLLFFGQTPGDPVPNRMAICVTPSSLLVENQGRSSIRLLDPAKDETLWRNLIAVRRIFP